MLLIFSNNVYLRKRLEKCKKPIFFKTQSDEDLEYHSTLELYKTLKITETNTSYYEKLRPKKRR